MQPSMAPPVDSSANPFANLFTNPLPSYVHRIFHRLKILWGLSEIFQALHDTRTHHSIITPPSHITELSVAVGLGSDNSFSTRPNPTNKLRNPVLRPGQLS
jgi:hypothetical protein